MTSTSLSAIIAEINSMLEVPDEELSEEQKAEMDQYLNELGQAEGDKADASAEWMRKSLATADFYKAEAKNFANKARCIENKVQRLKDHYLEVFKANGITRIKGQKYTLSVRPTQAVVIDNEQALPPNWIKEKVERMPMKAEMLKAMKAGEVILGAHLETHESLQMR